MPTSTRSTSLGFLDVREPFAMWQPQHPKDPLGDVSIVGNIPREITPSRLECLEISGGNRHVSHPFELPGLAGWIHSEPVEPSILGGDVHFISLCAKGIISRFALADVSGHGQSSSIIAQLLWDLIRRHINTWDQSELMRELNEALRSEVDENQFATVALFAYCRSTRELVFTNAGHPPALWYHAETGIWDWLEPATAFTRSVEGLPLGLIPMANYVQVAVRLDRSDLMILYTDGITEATDAAGNMLGQDGLLGIVQKLPLEFPGQMAVGLLGALQEFRGTALPDDDQTFFILRQLEG
jgi:serine phosphatase RsbU (regulator of sigma subunit)